MLSRRDFLKLAGVSTGAALLNGCVPKLLSPTQVPSATILPTSTYSPTITPTATLDFPTLLKPEINPYAQAYAYVEQDVLDRITTISLQDKAGNQFKAAIDPNTSIPLLVTNDNGEWQPARLKELAKRGGIRVGNILGSGVSAYYLKNDFNYGVLTSTWDDVQANGPDSFVYDGVEQEYKVAPFAGINDVLFLALIVGNRRILPRWLKPRIDSGSIQKDELIGLMMNYMKKTIDHFKDRMTEFIVVSEPLWDDPFWKIIGPGYIDIAFQAARDMLNAVGSKASLTFEWYDNHWAGGVWTAQTREIVTRLADKGLVDKVGMEMEIGHTTKKVSFNRSDVINTIESFGVPGEITEFIVQIDTLSGTQQERFIKQAAIYENLLGAALSAGVKDITFWGASDKVWYESNLKWDPVYAIPTAQPCMWDDNDQPKPAYYAVRKVLLAAGSTQA